jgi:hypothetical protein
MKVTVGLLTFLLAVAFASGMFLTMVAVTWYGLDSGNALAGYFGFGIPMIITGLATSGLWHDKRPSPFDILGWTSTGFGLGYALMLLILVIGIVMPSPKAPDTTPYYQPGTTVINTTPTSAPQTDRRSEWFLEFLWFGVGMLVCGGFGIYVLHQSEGTKPW